MSPPDIPCPRCGAALDVDWVEVTAMGETTPQVVSGRTSCPTKGCGTTCPICGRLPGDVHEGKCAPIIVRKLTDQTRVTTADCLTVIE